MSRLSEIMATYKCKAIIIKRHNFGEADRLLTLLSDEFGKIKVIAKGVRRPLSKLGGHLELFYLTEFVIAEGKNLDTICGAQIIESFPNLRKNLSSTQKAFYFAELIDKLLHEESENKEIFNMLKNALKLLDHKSNSLLLRYFELQLLSQLGHRPEVEHCVKCRSKLNPETIFWSNELGGVLCVDCRQYSEVSLEVSADAIKIIRLFLTRKIEAVNILKIKPELEKELENVIDGFLRYVSEKEFNSKKYVREK